jgi:hypothetical protein
MPNLTDKYRYQIFPDRIYFIRDSVGNVIEVSGQQIVESLSNGQKDKETERKTSELNQTQS